MTALHIAVLKENLDATYALLDANADVTVTDSCEKTVLHRAAEAGNAVRLTVISRNRSTDS